MVDVGRMGLRHPVHFQQGDRQAHKALEAGTDAATSAARSGAAARETMPVRPRLPVYTYLQVF